MVTRAVVSRSAKTQRFADLSLTRSRSAIGYAGGVFVIPPSRSLSVNFSLAKYLGATAAV